MKTIVVLCGRDRVNPCLIASLRHHFPKCAIRLAFTEDAGEEDRHLLRFAEKPDNPELN